MTEDLRFDAMAEEYLSEIERAAAALPVNRRAELLADVRSHILVAQAEAASGSPDGIEDPAVMSRILSKLGDPEAIVAAAVADLPSETPANSTARTDFRLLVKTVVILLVIGGLLGIGWFVVHILFWAGEPG
ncbi:HAAS signaling domain-containing protein [Streptosporangium sp. CA-115845]|uniref:HAAS signaling domain-containing protein n=1 Tax=Streptosporangium sp. CA-115845 TaxID=3240071 RepID=UPI003D91E4D8